MNLAELGKRAVACKHWRWLPGMLVDNIRIDGTCHHPGDLGMPWRQEDFREILCDKCIPDLSDPATLGCLLALVREAHEGGLASCLSTIFNDGEWFVGVGFTAFRSATPDALVIASDGHMVKAATEAEALVAALEAAS